METLHPANNMWNFTLAQRFSEAFDSSVPDQNIEYESVPQISDYNPKTGGSAPRGLGDFDRLFAFCGRPLSIPTRRGSNSTIDATSSSDDKPTPPSSVPDDAPHFAEYVKKVKGKGVRWTDQEGSAELAKYRTRSNRGSSSVLDASIIAQLLDSESELNCLESDGKDNEPVSPKSAKESKPLRRSERIKAQQTLPKTEKESQVKQVTKFRVDVLPFVPASVTPMIPLPILHTHKDKMAIRPVYTLTANEQKAKLVKKLAKIYKEEAKILRMPETIFQLGGNVNKAGIHVFVDLSNIVIGFNQQLKKNRISSGLLDPSRRVKQPIFSFHSLAIILERGRPVARRVLVGSTGYKDSEFESARVPEHIREAERLNYQANILERVEKFQRLTPTKKKGGNGSGYATASGYSSASETQLQGRFKMQEQAVDEILQMKMLETLVDYQSPSTIVLASGDAAEAEYSGGFLRTVERALAKGWKVEVVAWSRGLSYEYTSSGVLNKWKGKLSVLELDDFCEELLGEYTAKYVQCAGPPRL